MDILATLWAHFIKSTIQKRAFKDQWRGMSPSIHYNLKHELFIFLVIRGAACVDGNSNQTDEAITHT